MVGEPAGISLGQSEGEPCPHHWLIESPDGETSEGVCKLCGATRRFANYSYRQTMSPTRRAPASQHNVL